MTVPMPMKQLRRIWVKLKSTKLQQNMEKINLVDNSEEVL